MGQNGNLIVGLDLGTTKTCALVGEVHKEGIDIIGFGSTSSKGLRKGVVINIESTVDSINKVIEEAELMSGCKISAVYTGIAGSHIKGLNSHGVIGIKDSEVTKHDITRVIEAAKAIAIPLDREIIHILPQEFIVDEQNGIHERMHRTLKRETVIPPARNLRKQQERFDHFQNEYNDERPHEGIGMKVPSEIYQPSHRRLPKKLPQVEYPGHFEVRLVSDNCGIRWKNKGKGGRVCVSHLLAGEYVGLEEVDNELWNVYFGPVWLGRLDERLMRIIDKNGDSQRMIRLKNNKKV